MSMNFYSVRDLRTAPKTVWDNLESGGDVIITNNGKPTALMFRVEDGKLEETINAVRGARAMRSFNAMSKTADKRGRMSNSEIEKEIAVARNEKKHTP